MKRWLILVGVVVAVGLGSYGLSRALWPVAPENEDQVAWLAREFRLTPAQRAEVEKLHCGYLPVCSDHCAMIVDARERLADRPGDTALQAEVAQLEIRCQRSTLAHVRQIAACMAPEQGRRFLALVEPRILHHDHQAAFGLK
jgi:hypothetical protein